MLKSSEYAEALRTLGQWLEERETTFAEITMGAHRLNVEWRDGDGASGTHSFTRYDLLRSGSLMQTRRTQWGVRRSSQWSVCLHVLGQQLANMRLDVTRIQLDGDRLRVAGVCDRCYVCEWYGVEDLVVGDRVRSTERSIAALREKVCEGAAVEAPMPPPAATIARIHQALSSLLREQLVSSRLMASA